VEFPKEWQNAGHYGHDSRILILVLITVFVFVYTFLLLRFHISSDYISVRSSIATNRGKAYHLTSSREVKLHVKAQA